VGKFKQGGIYDSHYCWVMEVVGGKIRVLKEYMDGGYVAKQM
jgi:ketosteroid isomerase-like protein